MITWPNWVDLIVLIFVLRGCYVGFNSGVVAEFLHALGAVAVTAGSIGYWPIVARWFQPWTGWMHPILAHIVVFWLLFLMLLFAARQLVKAMLTLVKWERLHWLLQFFAVVVGGLRGVWWAGFMLLTMTSSGVMYLQASVEERSIMGPRVTELSHQYLELVTDQLPGAVSQTETPLPPLKEAAKKK